MASASSMSRNTESSMTLNTVAGGGYAIDGRSASDWPGSIEVEIQRSISPQVDRGGQGCRETDSAVTMPGAAELGRRKHQGQRRRGHDVLDGEQVGNATASGEVHALTSAPCTHVTDRAVGYCVVVMPTARAGRSADFRSARANDRPTFQGHDGETDATARYRPSRALGAKGQHPHTATETSSAQC